MGGNTKKRKEKRTSSSCDETTMSLTSFSDDAFVFIRRSTTKETVDIVVVHDDVRLTPIPPQRALSKTHTQTFHRTFMKWRALTRIRAECTIWKRD